MNLFEIFIIIIFLIILTIGYKNEFYSISNKENYIDENFINENRANNMNYKIYPYGPQNYLYNLGWYSNGYGNMPISNGLFPYLNPWWYYPNFNPNQ